MSVVLQSSGGGQVTISEPSTASNFTISLPAGSGTAAVQGVSSNLVQGTSQASTSGTAIDFTGIPSWAKRITVMLSGVKTSGTSIPIIQLGTGATPTYQTSGYLGFLTHYTSNLNWSSGIPMNLDSASTYVRHGAVTISNITSNTWCATLSMGQSDSQRGAFGAGSVALSAALTAVRITTVNGTDTFTAGSINIMYE